MPTIVEQISHLGEKVSNVISLVQGTRDKGIWHALLGNAVVFGCKANASGTDLKVTVSGSVAGDEQNFNPEAISIPLRHEEYSNIAIVYGEVFYSEDHEVELDASPGDNFGRYDFLYAFVGTAGPDIGFKTGTSSLAAKTDFDSNGLDTSGQFDPALPHGVIPLARIYVDENVTAITSNRIVDLRDFNGRLRGEKGDIGEVNPLTIAAELNAANSEIAAALSEASAGASANNASVSEAKASSWAEANEDTEVETGLYSAKHHSLKAAASASVVQSIYDSFDDRYLGAKNNAPTLDNDGDALATGAFYFDTTIGSMLVWDGSVWRDDSTLAEASAIAANADKIQTGLDVISTAAYVVTTNNNAATSTTNKNLTATDVISTNADVVSTNSDVLTTNSNVIATNADALITAADSAQTGLDKTATNADVVSTNADVVNTANNAANALVSENAAAGSLVLTNAAKDATLAALDSFDDRYLGEFVIDPTLDNDGNALVSGALHFNVNEGSNGVMKVYNGTSWLAAYADVSGALIATNNLSELTNAVSAKTNLGLGNIDNTSDASKPISVATQSALDAKVEDGQVLTDVPAGALFTDTVYSHPASTVVDPTLTGANILATLGTNADGHVTGMTTRALTKSDISLGSVDNTADVSKPISTATQTALDGKVDDSQVQTNVPLAAVFTDTTYSHPVNHPPSIITQDASNRFVTDVEKSIWNGAEPAFAKNSGFNKNLGTETGTILEGIALLWTQVTGSVTATRAQKILASTDTALTITFPLAPSPGDPLTIRIDGTGTVTFAGNGESFLYEDQTDTSIAFSGNNAIAELIYNGTYWVL